MSAALQLDAPRPALVIAEWDRNAREVVRVALDQYNGRHTINVRVWYRDDDDVLKPSKSGITLAVKHLPALSDAMAQALAKARQLELIEDTRDNINSHDGDGQ
jgi:hypothetical protein